MLPADLQTAFAKTRLREAIVQPAAHQMAIEDIRNWLVDNADQVCESTATPDINEEFSVGWTPNGKIVMFWASAGEYLVLTSRETQALRRLFGRMAPRAG